MRLTRLATASLTVVALAHGADAKPRKVEAPELWTLWSWLCADSGPGGECAPFPDQPILGRGECLIAA
jgi:hypothetical protein